MVTNQLPIPEKSTEPVLITQRNFAVAVQRVNTSTFMAMGLGFSASFGEDFDFASNETIDSGDLAFSTAVQQQSTGSISLPDNLLSHPNGTRNNTRVSFHLFVTDSLFLRRDNNFTEVGSIILAASVVGERFEGLSPPVILTFQRNLVSPVMACVLFVVKKCNLQCVCLFPATRPSMALIQIVGSGTRHWMVRTGHPLLTF